ncbi:contact-dependent growth inhibition system immunity protein [Streptomyces sp. NPDC088358]|uniref:contact-dependent growth inhibition system immunity protein n=1 Tax=Streptomyces sp. NPDC088358 TaxID=3365857 RepID=UPI00382DE084
MTNQVRAGQERAVAGRRARHGRRRQLLHFDDLPGDLMLPETLENLTSAYFHQDYDLEYDTPIEAVNDYREVNPPDSVNALREAIRSLLDAGTSEQKLAELWLEEGNAYYDPRDDSMTMTDWFRTMLQALDR